MHQVDLLLEDPDSIVADDPRTGLETRYKYHSTAHAHSFVLMPGYKSALVSPTEDGGHSSWCPEVRDEIENAGDFVDRTAHGIIVGNLTNFYDNFDGDDFYAGGEGGRLWLDQKIISTWATRSETKQAIPIIRQNHQKLNAGNIEDYKIDTYGMEEGEYEPYAKFMGGKASKVGAEQTAKKRLGMWKQAITGKGWAPTSEKPEPGTEMALPLVGDSLAEELVSGLLEQDYPIRNLVWTRKGDVCTAMASDLGKNWLDPWGRPIQAKGFKLLGKDVDRDGDVQRWRLQTTVAGKPVQLTIFND